MKKFELKATVGRKIILLTHFSFTEEQEKEFLTQILEKKNFYHDNMDWEVDAVLAYSKCKIKQGKERAYDKSRLAEFVEKYPDIIIAAAITTQVYDLGWPYSDVGYKLPKGVVLTKKVNALEQFGWDCKRIE